MSIISKIPEILASTNGAVLSPFKFNFDKPTKAIMQKNFSTLDRMAVAFDYSSRFDNFANTLKNPTAVDDFIIMLRNQSGNIKEAVAVADYLDRVARTFSVDRANTNIVELVWTANIANSLGEKDAILEANLSDLLFSLRMSPAYKNVSVMQLRGSICEMFENDMNESLAENLLELDKEQAQTYLGVAFTDNSQTKDLTKWYDYRTFEEMELSSIPSISNLSELKSALSSDKPESYVAAYAYVKKVFLSETDPSHPGYCENDLVREYKATVILATMVQRMGLDVLDKDNTLGFNFLARVKNIPIALENENPLLALSSEINQYEKEATMVAFKETLEINKEGPTIDTEKEEKLEKDLKELEKEFTSNQTIEEQLDEEPEKVLDSQEYVKKQLATYHKITDKKLADLTNSLEVLVKLRGRKSNFAKAEEMLGEIAKEFSVELITSEQEKNAKARLYANVDKVIDAVNGRFDDLTRSKLVFTKIRKKMGANLDIEEVAFDKALLGKLVNVTSPYQEKIIKDFYRLIKADPKLKSDAKYRQKSPTLMMAIINDRVKADPNTSPEIASLFGTFKLSPSQIAKYEEDKRLDEEFEKNEKDIDIDDVEQDAIERINGIS